MSDVLIASPPDFDLASLRSTCRALGLKCADLALGPGLRSLASNVGEPALAVLVLPDPGVVNLGERVERLRRLLPSATELIACAHRPTSADRDLLRDCGASDVVTPRAWNDSAVTERVLAELIQREMTGSSSFGGFRGATEPMRRLYQEIASVAPLDEPILILGETGTGKELAAHEIHQRSGRSGDIVPINVSALTDGLIGSELFGHERGAFTGADTKRQGLLAIAGSGTVFLDEIGDLDPASQAKLLRVLEERKVRPVGSNQWQVIKARIVLATNRDLATDCTTGRFRQDLHERIRGFTVRLPPLRDRRADIPLLVQHFVNKFNATYGGRRSVPSGAVDPLFRYDWPGNVRELQQVVRQAAAFATDSHGPISAARLHEAVIDRRRSADGGGAGTGSHVVRFDPSKDSWKQFHDRAQAFYFQTLLEHFKGNKSAAAKQAGYQRSQFYEILKKIDERLEEGEEKLSDDQGEG